MSLRAQFRTDGEGNYRFWSIQPTFYPCRRRPGGRDAGQDGPAPEPPGPHAHDAERAGHERLVTHIFVKDSPYLDSDAVFGRAQQPDRGVPEASAGQGADGRT
jgi:hydroxyquinol 1,2-dioxygenase